MKSELTIGQIKSAGTEVDIFPQKIDGKAKRIQSVGIFLWKTFGYAILGGVLITGLTNSVLGIFVVIIHLVVTSTYLGFYKSWIERDYHQRIIDWYDKDVNKEIIHAIRENRDENRKREINRQSLKAKRSASRRMLWKKQQKKGVYVLTITPANFTVPAVEHKPECTSRPTFGRVCGE